MDLLEKLHLVPIDFKRKSDMVLELIAHVGNCLLFDWLTWFSWNFVEGIREVSHHLP